MGRSDKTVANSSDLFLMQQLKEELTPSQLQQFMMLYPARKKSVGVGILLALFLGMLGVHKFYLGETSAGIIYLVAGTIGWIIIIPPIVVAIMCIIDACQMGGHHPESQYHSSNVAERGTEVTRKLTLRAGP
jgi:TM2 domain-containing membrane protein YozV